MSIFTHTFPRYVRRQLEDREAILAIGNNSLSENRFAKSVYPAGAFYTNTVEKQCILRMSSGVDLSEEGEEEVLVGKHETTAWWGPNLARNWILEGGMPHQIYTPLPGNQESSDGGNGTPLYPPPGIAAPTFTENFENQVFNFNNGGEIPLISNPSSDGPLPGLGGAPLTPPPVIPQYESSINPRGGFTNQPLGASSYGDPMTRSDAGDGFGIVPMPGIIDAKIKVKSAYGSLREAQVNFVCHNRRQLEILELLYMRPGYTMLLEWGWTPHIKMATNQEGEELGVVKSDDFFIMNEFFDPNKTFAELNRAVLDKKIKSGGNYDAMCGYVKNFEIKAREDGGYDCMTSIISMGELLEGLKGQRTFPGIKSKEDEEEMVYDNFEVYMMSLKQKMKVAGEVDEYDEQYDLTKWWKNSVVGGVFSETYSDLAKKVANPFGDHDISALITEAFLNLFEPGKGLDFYPEGVEEEKIVQAEIEDWENEAERSNSGWGVNFIPVVGTASWVTYREINHSIKKTTVAKKKLQDIQSQDVIDHFLIHKGETLGLGKEGNASLGESQYSYVRWDLLCEIMNEFVLDNATGPNKIKKELAKLSYTEDTQESPDDFVTGGHYLNYSSFAFEPGTKIPISLMEDSATEEGSNQNQGLGTQLIDMNDIMDGSLNPEICLFPHQITPGSDPSNSRKKLGTVLLGDEKWRKSKNPSEHVSATNRSIGLIYINIDHLLATYREMRYDSNGGDNEKWNILSFIKKIWEEDITGACAGTHNFIFQMPNSIGRIIDVSHSSAAIDTFELPIQGKNSIVRDFNFNTTIDKKLSSTIAIAAQSPKSISNLDQLSFAAFNKNIKNRFVQQTKDVAKAKKERKELELEVHSLSSQLYNFHLSLVKSNGKDNKKKNQTINVENAVQKVLSLQKMIIELSLTYPLKCSKYDNDVYRVDVEESQTATQGSRSYKLESCMGDPDKDHPNAGMRRRKASVSKSSIIPLKFNCKMDGIGGIVIGNIFKLPKDRLPKGYQGDDIAFVVMGVNHKITNGQDWITELSGQLILLASKKNLTHMSNYSLNEINDHKGTKRQFDKSINPTFTTIDGVQYRNRGKNAKKVVALFDNDYTDSVLEQNDIKLAPGGNALKGFISEKVGSSDGTDPYPQLDSGGDISPQLAAVAVKVFTTIRNWTNNPPGTGNDQEWTGKDSPSPTYKMRSGKSNPYHIIITGGNDQWHHDKSPNSNHCQGNGLDFVVTPNGRKYRDEIERILQKFAVANEGRFRYINEYADGGTPSGHASGDHFHITWYPAGIGSDGDTSYNKAVKLAKEGKLWSKGVFSESESDFKINVVTLDLGIPKFTDDEGNSQSMIDVTLQSGYM